MYPEHVIPPPYTHTHYPFLQHSHRNTQPLLPLSLRTTRSRNRTKRMREKGRIKSESGYSHKTLMTASLLWMLKVEVVLVATHLYTPSSSSRMARRMRRLLSSWYLRAVYTIGFPFCSHMKLTLRRSLTSHRSLVSRPSVTDLLWGWTLK